MASFGMSFVNVNDILSNKCFDFDILRLQNLFKFLDYEVK